MIHWTSKRRLGLTVKCQKTFPPGLSISKRLNRGISLHLSFSQVLHPIWAVEVLHCVILSTLLFSERDLKRKKQTREVGYNRSCRQMTFGFSPHWTSHCELSLWLQGWHIPSVFYSFIKRTFDCFHYLGASRNNICLPGRRFTALSRTKWKVSKTLKKMVEVLGNTHIFFLVSQHKKTSPPLQQAYHHLYGQWNLQAYIWIQYIG